MRTIVITFMSLLFLSCTKKTDLEKVDFSSSYKEIFKGVKFEMEDEDIATTLPCAFTEEMTHFSFGNIEFQNTNKEEKVVSSKVKILFNNASEQKTSGIIIKIEEEEIGNKMFSYLKKQYNTPKTLLPAPSKNDERRVTGYSAYLWNIGEKTMIFSQYYYHRVNEYPDGHEEYFPRVSSTLYLIDNNVLTSFKDFKQTAVERLLKTYSP